MSSRKLTTPEEIVRAYLDRMAAAYSGGKSAHYDLLYSDATVIVPGSTPVSGVIQGVEGLKSVSAGLKDVLDQKAGLSIIIEKVVVEGSSVAVLARGRAEAASGRPYNNVYFMWFEVEGERIRSIAEFCDLSYAMWSIFGQNPASAAAK